MGTILTPIWQTGNKKSLSDAIENGINIREELLRLYRDYYHAGIMKLVVIGGGNIFFYFSLFVSLFILSRSCTIQLNYKLNLLLLIFS
jgi:hypothetical protein